LGTVARRLGEYDVHADGERLPRADAVEELGVQCAPERPRTELSDRRLVDLDDDDGRRGRWHCEPFEEHAPDLEEPIERSVVEPLHLAEQHQDQRDGGRGNADEIFPDLAVETREHATHRRNSKPPLAWGPPRFGHTARTG